MGGLLWALFIGLGGLPYSQLIQILGSGTRTALWLAFAQAAAAVIQTVTGNAPLTLTNAVHHAIKSLTQYGLCTQSTTPTPDAPVDIMCNNGAIKAVTAGASTQNGTPTLDNYVPVVGFPCGNTELQGIDTSKDYIDPSTQSIVRVIGKMVFDGTETFGKSTAYGTAWYINGASSAWGANRNKAVLCTHFVAGEASSGSPDGTCFFNPTGHFYFRASGFDNAAAFKAWVKDQHDAGTPVVVYFVKSTSETEPWDGTTNIITDGTPEVLTVSATGAETQTVTDIPMLLSVNDYKDEDEIISGLLTHKVGIKVLDGTESGWALSDSGSTHRFRGIKPSDCHTPASRAPSVCTHFKYVSTGSAVGGMFIGASQYWYFIPTEQTIDTVEEWTAWLAAQYAAGTPVIVLYPRSTKTTEQTEPHALHTVEGDNIVSWTYPGSTKTVEYAYQEPTNKVGTAKVGTAKAG